MKSNLFPTTDLSDLTLAQLLLEHERDWVDYHGLQKGVFWTARHLGLKHASNIARQKFSFFYSPENLDQKLEAKAAELAANKEEILAKEESWKTVGYRRRTLINNVNERLELLTTDTNSEDLERISVFINEHYRAIKEQLENNGELARQRQQALDQKYPDASVSRATRKVKNFFNNNQRILAPALVGIIFGTSGGCLAYNYFSNQDRNRPTEEISSAFTTEHPGTVAAITITNSVRAGNELFKEYKLNSEISLPELKSKSTSLVAKINQAKVETKRAQEYYARAEQNINLLVNGNNKIWSAWEHTTEETGHYYPLCMPSGNTTICTQQYTCDYIDHTWKFNLNIAAEGVELYNQGLRNIDAFAPAAIKLQQLENQLELSLSKNETYLSLSPDKQKDKKNLYSDVFTSITIAGNDLLRNDLLNAESQAFTFIKDNYNYEEIFKSETTERNEACSMKGNPPLSYTQSETLNEEIRAVADQYQSITEGLKKTAAQLWNYKIIAEKISTSANNDEIMEESINSLGDQTIIIQQEINPDSQYAMLSRGWRTAIPFMLLFGLGGLGVGAGYAGVSALDRRRRRKEFAQKYKNY